MKCSKKLKSNVTDLGKFFTLVIHQYNYVLVKSMVVRYGCCLRHLVTCQ